jgi:hypothetical protein
MEYFTQLFTDFKPLSKELRLLGENGYDKKFSRGVSGSKRTLSIEDMGYPFIEGERTLNGDFDPFAYREELLDFGRDAYTEVHASAGKDYTGQLKKRYNDNWHSSSMMGVDYSGGNALVEGDGSQGFPVGKYFTNDGNGAPSGEAKEDTNFNPDGEDFGTGVVSIPVTFDPDRGISLTSQSKFRIKGRGGKGADMWNRGFMYLDKIPSGVSRDQIPDGNNYNHENLTTSDGQNGNGHDFRDKFQY